MIFSKNLPHKQRMRYPQAFPAPQAAFFEERGLGEGTFFLLKEGSFPQKTSLILIP